MKQSKNIFLLLFVGLFLISTTGVTVYKHYCNHGGMLYGVYVDVEHGCDTIEDEDVDASHQCCELNSDEGVNVEEDCCTSSVERFQIDTDLATNDFSIDFNNAFVFTLSKSEFVFVYDSQGKLVSNKAPPILTTSKRLALIQEYLI